MTNYDLPEYYTLYNYDVVVHDWDDTGESCLHDFREKMLKYFGNEYAIDFLFQNT